MGTSIKQIVIRKLFVRFRHSCGGSCKGLVSLMICTHASYPLYTETFETNARENISAMLSYKQPK